MHGDDDPGSLSDRGHACCWIEVVGGWVGLDGHELRSDSRNGKPCGYVGVGRNDDLVTRTNSERPKSEHDASSPLATPAQCREPE